MLYHDISVYHHNCLHFIFILLHLSTSGKILSASVGDEETWVRNLGQEDPLEKETAIRSSILA